MALVVRLYHPMQPWGEGDTKWWRRTAWKLRAHSLDEGGMAIGMAVFSTESLPRVRIILRNLIHFVWRLQKKQKEGGGSRNFCKFSVNHGKDHGSKVIELFEVDHLPMSLCVSIYTANHLNLSGHLTFSPRFHKLRKKKKKKSAKIGRYFQVWHHLKGGNVGLAPPPGFCWHPDLFTFGLGLKNIFL